MKKSTKIILALSAVGALAGGISDIQNMEAKGLRTAHLAAWPGRQAECETMQDGGETWALCRFWRSAPSVWLKRGEAWASANGGAQMVIEAVSRIDAGVYKDLPRLYVDRQKPVYMTDAVRERFDEIRAEIEARK